MMNRDQARAQADWERLLGEGLDRLSALQEEAPPDLAALQMLVTEVQADQRRALYSDLLKFWAVGAMLLLAMVYGLLQAPLYFLAIQVCLALLLLLGAGLWQVGWRRIPHE